MSDFHALHIVGLPYMASHEAQAQGLAPYMPYMALRYVGQIGLPYGTEKKLLAGCALLPYMSYMF